MWIVRKKSTVAAATCVLPTVMYATRKKLLLTLKIERTMIRKTARIAGMRPIARLRQAKNHQ